MTVRQRAELLNKIKAAEAEGAKREENARAKAAQAKAQTQTECSRIMEGAEKEGRTLMRNAIEEAKAECAKVKEVHVADAVREGEVKEAESASKTSAVSDLMLAKFKKEYDVKN